MTSTSPIDICNRALSEIAAQATIAAFDEGSQEATLCGLWYDTLRRQLLRAAPWGFARKTAVLSLLGAATDVPNLVPYPWGYEYTHPADALRIRYLLPPTPPLNTTVVGTVANPGFFFGPSRSNRFIISNVIPVGQPDQQMKVILSNLQQAQAVYVVDVENTTLFDDQFEQALVSALAAKLCLPITGNKDMRAGFIASANDAIITARASDGNEAIPSTDHTPDWMAARGVITEPGWNAFSGPGDWLVGWDNFSWGM